MKIYQKTEHTSKGEKYTVTLSIRTLEQDGVLTQVEHKRVKENYRCNKQVL